MRRSLRERVRAALARVRRFERREWREFRRWAERTSTLVHLSVLLFVPLLIALVTALSNAVESLSFLLFPPLAAGTYTLFSDPEGTYASPVQFVAGLTVGALCGWGALAVSGALGLADPTGSLQVGAIAAALAVFAAGAVTWALSIEEPAAYSTALLGLLVPPGQEVTFVASVFLASSIVAVVFFIWRERVYDRRAQFLYESVRGDDHVLVPMRGDDPESTATLGARLAAAHDAGKVVLLDLVDDEYVARAEREIIDDGRRPDGRVAAGGRRSDGGPDTAVASAEAAVTATAATAATDDSATVHRGDSDAGDPGDSDAGDPGDSDTAGSGDSKSGDRGDDTDRTEVADSSGAPSVDRAVAESASHLEERAAEIEGRIGVPCEVVVAVSQGSAAATVRKTATAVNCDLIAASYEERHGALSPYVRDLFRGRTDVVVHRSRAGRTRWKDVLVPVRSASDVAHGMLEFATRLTGRTGSVSVATCVTSDRERRRAEDTLADLVEPFDGEFETRTSTRPIERYLAECGSEFDLIIMGASRNRSAASRLVSPPTFERIQDVDADVAIVDRG